MVCRRYDGAPVPDLPDLAKSDYAVRVDRAIDHITRNLAEPLRLHSPKERVGQL